VTDDPDNCGACGNVCSGSTPYCIDGECVGFLAISVINADTTAVSTTHSLTVTHSLETTQTATGPGANRAVVVVVASQGNAAGDAKPQTVTYATRAMIQVPDAELYSDNVWSGVYYMIEGATTGLPAGAGDYPLEITATNNNTVLTAGVIELTGVSQTSPVDNFYTNQISNCSNGLPNITVTTSSDLAFAVDVAAAKGLSGTGTPLQTGQIAILDHSETPNGVGLASYKVGVTPIGPTLFQWSGVDCASWVHVGVSFGRASSP
jgi:hypothetical protein